MLPKRPTPAMLPAWPWSFLMIPSLRPLSRVALPCKAHAPCVHTTAASTAHIHNHDHHTHTQYPYLPSGVVIMAFIQTSVKASQLVSGVIDPSLL